MDRPQASSPPLSPQKSSHHRSTSSSPSHCTPCDGDEGRPSVDGQPSSRRSDKLHESDNTDKASSKKPRHRHSPVQLATLNELFDRNEHPSLEERTELAEKLGMETKTVNAWFQNKRASTKKRNRATSPKYATPAANDLGAPEKPSKQPLPSNLPSIANLLNFTPPVPTAQLPSHSSRPRSRTSSTRRTRQKDLHLNDRVLTDPHVGVSHSQNNTQEPTLESSFFAGPSEFLSQDRISLSHHRGHDPESGAVHSLHNTDSDRTLLDTDSRFVSENEPLPSRRGRSEVARMRTSPEQVEELRRAYAINDHPTRDQRQQLANKIGMRLQSVTNWFQNQRSQAKKHREESSSTPDVSAHPTQRRPSAGDRLLSSQMPHPPLPPRSHHPSLVIPEHDSLPVSFKSSAGGDDHREVSTPRSTISLPPSSSSRVSSPRIRRNILPYTRYPRDLHIDEGRHYDNSSESAKADDGLSRPRRARPEPYQLDALKKLLHRTLTPSIEERSALALEIGMDIGKVTNWFRNVRQNARKRGKRPGVSGASTNPHEHDISSGSSVYDDDDAMDLAYEDIIDQEMDERSEEEYQEAVTPFTDVSSSPSPNKRPRSHPPVHDGTEPMDVGLVEPSAFQEFRKVVGMNPVSGSSDYDLGMNAMTYSGVKIEDALLLLSFHKHVVH